MHSAAQPRKLERKPCGTAPIGNAAETASRGLSARWPCPTARFITALMRRLTRPAVSVFAVQIGSSTAMTSLPAPASTGMSPSRGNTQSRIVERRFCSFFPPGFHPGVDRGHRLAGFGEGRHGAGRGGGDPGPSAMAWAFSSARWRARARVTTG